MHFLINKRPSTVTKIFSKAEIFSTMFLALNHGGNDAQKTMGIITMTLISAGFIKEFSVPLWVKVSCALAMALGTALGGKRIIKTMGSKMARIVPVNGFAAELGCIQCYINSYYVPCTGKYNSYNNYCHNGCWCIKKIFFSKMGYSKRHSRNLDIYYTRLCCYFKFSYNFYKSILIFFMTFAI
jgi:hypothetical protein